jgi:hypothetical protein
MSRGIKDSATLTKLDQQMADAPPPFIQEKIKAKKKGGGKGGKKGKVPPAFLKQQGK